MKDEHIWLLLFGRGWVALEAIEERHDPVFTRLCKVDKLEVNKNLECVRLKEEE
jgi:hypothetical protein